MWNAATLLVCQRVAVCSGHLHEAKLCPKRDQRGGRCLGSLAGGEAALNIFPSQVADVIPLHLVIGEISRLAALVNQLAFHADYIKGSECTMQGRKVKGW